MDEEYDYCVLGTGLEECVLSGLLSMEGKKVLHLDRNDYYGGECASLNLIQLFKHFSKGEPSSTFGRDRDYNIDLVPKFMMANGQLVKLLTFTNVTKYLEFKQISGSYVYRDGRISKVPSTEMEALRSSLMGIFEKRRAKKFFEFCQNFNENEKSSWQGLEVEKVSMNLVYQKFGLESGTQDFIGHALALHSNEEYLTKPAKETILKIRLYMSSMARYGKSPYIYPMYGLGDLPQGFARLAAVYGGTYMLNKPVDSIEVANGKVIGVRSGEEIVKCKAVIGDPSYFPNLVKSVGKIIRAICFLKNPIPNTDNLDSVQLILPQRQLNRKSDIYIALISENHKVCAKGFFVAIISTIVETEKPEDEIKPALNLLGQIIEKFISVSDIKVPLNDGIENNIFISKSLDPTSHFETVYQDVADLYKRITGKDLEIKDTPEGNEQSAN